ncbi:GTPase domain-containing protein [Solirubrobacter soli]|uniref:GTPase domain-containing protein n=1 Tax=Solirubrobacter soli TaxID=363832 RepID=UPI00146D59B2|nr:GTPase domain-containing protein [Solirubrobacter soli]
MNGDWPARVLEGIAEVAGAPARDEVAERWAEHAARDKPEITVLGPYDAGKSSLIRRLLAEDDVAIPDWLTVSARRETFELNEVEGPALTYTDAPGFGSTVERHDAAAEDALAISDAFLLVVPPQLLTEHRGWVTEVLSGEHFFGRPGGAVPQAAIAVIAQADSLGIDPDDDPEGMRELADRKRTELVAQLGDGGAGLEVLVVSADPYEEQARTAQPVRADFEAFREWDGIDALRSALAELAARSSELRTAAELRYLSRVGGMVHAEASALAEQVEAAAAELSARAMTFAQMRDRVDGVVGAARVALASDLISVGTDAAEEVSPSDPGAAGAVEGRLMAAIGRWDERRTAELEILLGEASVEVDGRLGRPSAERTEAFLRSLQVPVADADATTANSRVIGILNDVRDQLHGVAKGTFALRLGESFDDALEAARKIKHPKRQSADTGAKTTGTGAVKLQAALQVVDGVLAIATTLDAERAQGALEQKLRDQREAARDRLERAAEAIATEVVEGEHGFRSRATVALDALRSALAIPADASAVEALAEDARRQRERLDSFAALLADCPALTGGG